GYIRIELFDEDYDDDGDYDEETPGPTAEGGPLARCDYDPCVDMQVPCAELQRATSCLCPGVSGEDVIPEQPRLWEVARVSGSAARVHWCAPPSTVDGYRLTYGPLGSPANASTQRLPSRARLFTLEGLTPGTGYRVCAVAYNRAGDSRLAEEDPPGPESGFGPCATFATMSGSALTLHISTAAVLLLLLVVACALLGCFCARRRRGAAAGPPEPSIGLQNPTYEEDKAGRPRS
ncbi:hypothetical protein scyTo_0024918, partial [Scyliorhinus torazame]|nr:hypothetical protein [Scyliorhinus torazame]